MAENLPTASESGVGLSGLLGRLSVLQDLCSLSSSGCRKNNGADWYEGVDLRSEEKLPLIAVCEHPGNWLADPTWKRIAVSDRKEDRDFVLAVRDILPDVIDFLRSLE